MIKEVCTNVEMEPRLQPFDGETLQLRTANREDEARLDLWATGFWSRGRRPSLTFVFYPSASSYQNKELVIRFLP